MAYTDIERRILDMWPKFEDGCYVQLGDKAVANSGRNEGKEFTVGQVYFENEHDKLLGSVPDGCYWNYKAADPYVKRPAPKVLDADGVDIKAGDRVYSIENDNSYIVRSINGSGTLELEGFEYKGWSPKFFTHMQPAIDADGVLIKAGDTVWLKDGTELLVEEVNRYGARCFDGEIRRTLDPKSLTHTQPDSWKRLEDDATLSPWSYCNEHGLFVSTETFAIDLIRRAKALAEKGAGR